jgi:hypothetical protein
MEARTWRHSTRGATAGSKSRLAQVLSVNTKMRLCPQPTRVWSNVLKTRGVWLGRRRKEGRRRARKATGRREASKGQKQSKQASKAWGLAPLAHGHPCHAQPSEACVAPQPRASRGSPPRQRCWDAFQGGGKHDTSGSSSAHTSVAQQCTSCTRTQHTQAPQHSVHTHSVHKAPHTRHPDLMVWNKEAGGREGKKAHVVHVGTRRYDDQGYAEEKP